MLRCRKKHSELPTFSLKLITFSSVWVNTSGALPTAWDSFQCSHTNEIVPLAQIARSHVRFTEFIWQYVLDVSEV